MIMHFAYAGVSLVTLALLASWMIAVSRRTVTYRVLVASTALVLAFVAWSNVNAMLGYAVAAQPKGEVELVGMVDARTQGFIYLWIKEANGPRAYKVPYSEGLAKSLLAAEEQAKGNGGSRIKIKFKSNGNRSGGSASLGRDKGLGHDDGPPVRITVVQMLPPKG